MSMQILSPQPCRRRNAGSILIFSMIVALLVAGLCGSYLALILTEYRQSRQSFQFHAATDLAEAGIEEALWALDRQSFDGWTQEGTSWYRVFNGPDNPVDLGQASTGQLRVRVDDAGSGARVITSEGRILHPNLPEFSKQVRVVVKQGDSLYQGLTVRNSVVFNNRVTMDSYDSTKGHHNPTTNRADADSLVCLAGWVQLNDTQLWGHLAVGSETYSGVGTPMNGGWLRNSATVGTPTFDTNAVTTGVKMDWPDTPIPPKIADTGGQYFSVVSNTTMELGNPSSTTPQYYYYRDNGGTLNLSDYTTLKINGPVVLVIERGLNLSGYASIHIDSNPNAKLTIYASENINISGTLTVNDQPESQRLMIYGCGYSGQNIAISGNVNLVGVFHGPNWNVNVSGNVHWSGAILASYVNFSSGMGFHYDTALGGGGDGVNIQSWSILREQSRRDFRVPFAP